MSSKSEPLPCKTQEFAPPVVNGRTKSGPELAVHVEFVPERGRTGRQAQTAPKVRVQHRPLAETFGVFSAHFVGIKR